VLPEVFVVAVEEKLDSESEEPGNQFHPHLPGATGSLHGDCWAKVVAANAHAQPHCLPHTPGYHFAKLKAAPHTVRYAGMAASANGVNIKVGDAAEKGLASG
jgi:hypothetical protein